MINYVYCFLAVGQGLNGFRYNATTVVTSSATVVTPVSIPSVLHGVGQQVGHESVDTGRGFLHALRGFKRSRRVGI